MYILYFSRPLAQPGFDSLGLSAPVIVQLNPEGKWSNAKPDCLEEERLRAVVQHLVNSKALSAAQSYCCQCAQENKVVFLSFKPKYIVRYFFVKKILARSIYQLMTEKIPLLILNISQSNTYF